MKYFLIFVIRMYQVLLSPWLGGGCRFVPSCSNYTLQAIRVHGALRGTHLGLKRLFCCHPLCSGGYDPVPCPRPKPSPWKASPP